MDGNGDVCHGGEGWEGVEGEGGVVAEEVGGYYANGGARGVVVLEEDEGAGVGGEGGVVDVVEGYAAEDFEVGSVRLGGVLIGGVHGGEWRGRWRG